ncbi:MAG TPA: M35 family metallo-endopeptidase [Dyella sp.]|uniref:M35 family metallo-endopeptidase n=1 Tax=Dyella sp. TaxID=1869338 RepID=UPI002CA7CC81|nr:M35 family metallo-endopeptidase [Dyella sp.]HUB89498.1 M35 family metallo-endopeptidase [Dyella sp.]
MVALVMWAQPSHALDASERLSVVLSKPDSARDADAGAVVVTITNKSSEPLFLPKFRTPLNKVDGHIHGHFMDVKNDEGKQAEFIGIFVDILPVGMSFYTRIEPGQSLSGTIKLSRDYDLSEGGNFKVSYEQPFEDNVQFDEYGEVHGHSDTVTSNVLDIWVSASLAAAAKKLAFAPTALPDIPELSCKPEQMAALFTARMSIASWVSKAEGYAKNLYDVEKIQIEDNDGRIDTRYRPRMKPDFKYQYWFGALDNDQQTYDLRPSYSSVWDKDDFYPFKQLNAISKRAANPDFHYSCGCPVESDPLSGAMARTNDPYLVLICDFYFEIDKGQQVQTLVHELSHFHDEDADSAYDYAYGRQAAHALATSDRKKALRNADTIGFFVQDVVENTQ